LPNRKVRDLLSKRELEVAELVAEGRVNKEIGCELQMAPATVASHLRHMFAKLGVDRRAALIHFLWKHGSLSARTPARGGERKSKWPAR